MQPSAKILKIFRGGEKSNWPQDSSAVQITKKFPPLKKYYPAIDDLDTAQRKFFLCWRNQWQQKSPISADTSYIFIYIYELLKAAISRKQELKKFILELDALARCYEKQVGIHVNGWITDLYEYHGFFESALSRFIANEQWRPSVTERILNLKAKLGIAMDGKDLLNLGRNCGIYSSKYVQQHLPDALKMAEETLLKFKKQKGKEFLEYLKFKYPHEKRHIEYLLSGTSIQSSEAWTEGSLIQIKTTYPASFHSPIRYFRFDEMSYVVQFSIENVHRINWMLEMKYRKKNIPTKEPELPQSALEKLWKAQILEPFRNPNKLSGNKKCPHTWLALKNHWDIYRKYFCINCDEEFMCESDRRLAEAVRPHQISGYWLKGICPTCRDLDDTSPITRGKLMYGSTFYAQHWREIGQEYDRMVLDAAVKARISAKEASFKVKFPAHAAENTIRKKYKMPPVGEGWISETVLYKNLRNLFQKHEVIQHARTKWLGMMHLDVFIPSLKLAFEYQGRQHYEPVDFFGGKVAFEKVGQRDQEKARLCKENSIKLIYIRQGDDFSEMALKNMLKEYLSSK